MRPAALLSALLVFSAAAAAAQAYQASRLCRYEDPRIFESSGLASSSRSDDYFYTHNDSDTAPEIFAVSRGGETHATLKVAGARNYDWEDVARGPGDGGAPALFIGDIGDNGKVRKTIDVYRIPEPEIDASAKGIKGETGPAERFELEYPDGAHDAETLLIHPVTKRLFVVTKSWKGSGLYAAPLPLIMGSPNRLQKVGDFDWDDYPVTVRSLKDNVLCMMATGGSISGDGKRVVVRTYTDAYEWSIEGNDVAKAMRAKPLHIELPETRQGEAITYTRDGKGLLISSEGKHASVHELRPR
jgi:hypothetical protein